ncbi:MAG: DNA polymerase III subunit beta [Clostridia bacterium]|nr:DNA polymerase III subunit beta [Clostridia bacterium]
MAIQFLSDKKTLLNLIMPALAATSGKSTLPALEGLLFKLEDNVLTVCGYDLEKGVRTRGVVVPKEEGAVILNAQKVAAIIKNFPDCDISFEADDKNMVRISGAASDFVIHGLTAEAFPNMPQLGGENAFCISQSIMKEMIASTCFAVSQVDARPILTGEFFHVENRSITAVALDNYRMALREEKECVFDNENAFSFVVPGKSLLELSRLLRDSDDMLRVEFTAKYVIFKVDDIVLFSRLLEGEFLDYKRAIPSQSKIFVNLDRRAFEDSVSRASLLVDEKLKTPLRCKFEGDVLHVTCSTQYGKVNDQLRIQKEGDDLEIGFNNRFLLDALRACKDDELKISLSTPFMSMMIEPKNPSDTGTYLYLVLPVKLKD